MDISHSAQLFADAVAIEHDFPSANMPSRNRLSEDERRVVALSHFDRLASIEGLGGRLARFFGRDHGKSLADDKLEALRRFAVVLRVDGSPDDEDIARFIAAGYSQKDVVLVRLALRQTAPHPTSRSWPVAAWAAAALVATAIYTGMNILLHDTLASALVGAMSFLFLILVSARAGGATGRAPRRWLRTGAAFLAAAISTVSLQSCTVEAERVAVAPGASENIIVLPDGGTMLARHGSLNRSMAEWIGSADKKGASLTAPGAIFETRSTRLTQQGLGDAATLATLLRATPDAHVLIIGRGDPLDDPVNARLVGQMRSEALATLLESIGVSPEQIGTASKDDLSDDDHNQLRLVAWRGLTRRDFRLASR